MSKKPQTVRVNHVLGSELLEAARDSLWGANHEGPCKRKTRFSQCHLCITAEVVRRLRLYVAIMALYSEIARLREARDK